VEKEIVRKFPSDQKLKSNVEIMENARECLKGRWQLAISAGLIYFVCAILVSGIPKIGSLINLFISGAFTLGVSQFFLRYSQKENPDLGIIFDGFNHYKNATVAYILMIIYICLWTLLLIIPGIIASLSYSQVFYILSENPELSGSEALRKSKDMMNGHKLKFFTLGLRFFGWGILSILTLGIGFIWLFPYMTTSSALFYKDIKDSQPM